MKIIASIAYAVVLIAELHVLDTIGLTPDMRYWWALFLGYSAAAIYGAFIGGE